MHCNNQYGRCQQGTTLEQHPTHFENCVFALKTCPVANCDKRFQASEEIAHQLEHAHETITEVIAIWLILAKFI